MSSFWQKAMAQVAPPPAPRQDPGSAPGSPWWMPPIFAVDPQPVDVVQPEAAGHKRPPERSEGACPNPDCVDGDYFRPTKLAAARCYTCGYPHLQSGSGDNGTTKKGVRPARQVNPEGDWRPQHIIGRVDE